LNSATSSRSLLYVGLVNFIDFRKAFDNVHRELVWRIVKLYCILDKIL